jgi:hypothetical protein
MHCAIEPKRNGYSIDVGAINIMLASIADEWTVSVMMKMTRG